MRGMQDIEVFVRTAECGNVSAAARELGLSPAVASLAIKRLEDELQTILCIRSTRSLRLTQAGTVFLTHARHLLDPTNKPVKPYTPKTKPNAKTSTCPYPQTLAAI